MSYSEDQKEWLKKHPDIKIGSNIFILYDDFLKEKSNWGCNWVYTMNKTVGKKGIMEPPYHGVDNVTADRYSLLLFNCI